MSSVAIGILSGALMGIVFGFALEKSRVFEPGMIVGQMQLRNWIMLKVFLSAVATGAVVLAFLHGFGFVKLQPKAALYAADIVGGLILGAGIALAGACPGTTLAQIGVGYRDAIFTLLGGLAGAVAFSYAQPWLAKSLIGTGPKLILSDLAGIPYWQGALALAEVIVVVRLLMERARPWRQGSRRRRRRRPCGDGACQPRQRLASAGDRGGISTTSSSEPASVDHEQCWIGRWVRAPIIVGILLLAVAIPLGFPQTGWNWISWIRIVPSTTAVRLLPGVFPCSAFRVAPSGTENERGSPIPFHKMKTGP